MLSHLHTCLPIILLFAVACFTELAGQHLTLKGNADEQPLIERYAVSVRQPDSLGIVQALSQSISNLQENGYFQAAASVPVRTDSNRWESKVSVGPRYDWARLSPGNLGLMMQEKSGFRERYAR